MDNKPLTVLTCCYKHSQFISRCYNALLDQTLDKKLWSWLFVADGTNNDKESLPIIQRIKENEDKRLARDEDGLKIRILERPVKTRLAQAKNFGLKYIETPLIAFQDIDDLSLPNRLEMQLDVIQNGVYNTNDLSLGFYKPDVCGTLSWTELEDGRWVKSCFDVNQYQYHDQIAARLAYENIMTHGSVILRKSVLDSVGGYPEDQCYLGMEDWILWAKMIQRGFWFYNIQERLYIWSGGTSVPR